MSTLFDLTEDIGELPLVNRGVKDYKYRQITPDRSATGDAFKNGTMDFKFSISGQDWWVPKRSYFRIRAQLTKVGGAALQLSDGIAPAMGLVSGLFQSGRVLLKDREISIIDNSYFSQIDSLYNRMTQSKAWLDGIGASINWWNSDFSERLSDISSDGVEYSPSETELTSTKAQLEFTATAEVAYTDATRLITFNEAIPDAANTFKPGDQIFLPFAGGTHTGVVQTIESTTTLKVVTAFGADDASANIAFTRIRQERAKESRRIYGMELIWSPPFPIWKVDHAMPLGNYNIRLVSHSDFEKRAVEALADKSPVTDYTFEITGLYLFISTLSAGRISNKKYLLDLDVIDCTSRTIQANASTGTFSFEVSPSSYALTVAFQNTAAGTSTQYPISKFVMQDSEELKLTRLSVNYAGETKPDPDSDLEKTTNALDFYTQRYVDSSMYSGMYFRDAGPESYKDWLSRGPYYHFAWNKDGSDTSTTVRVRWTATGGFVNGGQLLLFSHRKNLGVVQVKDSRVVNVSVNPN